MAGRVIQGWVWWLAGAALACWLPAGSGAALEERHAGHAPVEVAGRQQLISGGPVLSTSGLQETVATCKDPRGVAVCANCGNPNNLMSCGGEAEQRCRGSLGVLSNSMELRGCNAEALM